MRNVVHDMQQQTTYKHGKATVRIHGQCDPDNLKAATTRFLKQAEAQRKRKKVHCEATEETNPNPEDSIAETQIEPGRLDDRTGHPGTACFGASAL